MKYYVFFFFKQKTAYEMLRSLVGSEMCIRDSLETVYCFVVYTKVKLFPVPADAPRRLSCPGSR